MPRTMALLNEHGDVTIGWSAENDEMMKEIVAKKLKEGYTFFVVNTAGQEVRLKSADQIGDARKIVLTDKDAEELLRKGKIGLVTRERAAGDYEAVGRARTPEEVVSNDTLAVRPMRGG